MATGTKMPSSTQTVPYFPPPPTSAATAKTKSRPRPISTTRHYTSPPEASPRASPLQRSRTFFLPCLLVFTFAIFVLSIIYGYCVAKSHTQLTREQLASNSTVELDWSIFSRHKRSPSPILVIPPSSVFPAHKTNDTTPAARNPATRNKDHLTSSLVFYLLTSPAFLITLLSTELILHHSSPLALTRRRAHLSLLLLHICSLVGFILSSSFWTSCELPAPQTTALKHICPAQVRGHFMYGIHELSIAKVVLAWLVVVGLLCHIVCLVKSSKAERSAWARTRRQSTGQPEEVAIKMEEGLVHDGQVQASKKQRKRDRIVRFLPLRT